MRIVSDLEEFQNIDSNIVVAFGNFDGIHFGHKQLIATLVEKAKEIGGKAAVFTFSTHPVQVLRPEENIKLLLPKEEKEAMLAQMGVEILFSIPFDTNFRKLVSREFINKIIVEKIKAKGVVVGYNFNFGYQGKGDAALLEELGAELGFFVEVIPPIYCHGEKVSSTLIRHLLKEGNVEEAGKFLGYQPFLKGKVVSGDCRGRQIGFPTANLDLPEGILVPSNGVYVVKVQMGDLVLEGVANIGYKPTFKADQVKNVEMHLFNFSEDIYGHRIKVEFIHFIRSERTFNSCEQLVAQIKKDVSEAKRFLQKGT